LALRHHARALLCVYAVALAYFSFYPFEFVDQLEDFVARLRHSIEAPFDITGVSRHVLTFALFGFLLAMAFPDTRPRHAATLLALLFGLSIAVELIQAAIPARHSRAGDVLIHFVSGSVGVGVATLVTIRSRRMASLRSAGRPLWIVFLVFTLLASAVVILIVHPFGTSLATWRADFPIALGNEPTGDRPWRGRLHGLAIYDRALAPEEIAQLAGASFDAAEGAELRHALQPLVMTAFDEGSGPIAESTARDTPPLAFGMSGTERIQWLEERSGLALTESDAMLQTLQPTAWLAHRLRDTAAVTVEVVCATRSTAQVGPARILAWSVGPGRGNLSIGQRRAALILRVRTPTSPLNGARHEAIWYGVFRDAMPRHIVLTYDGRHMRAFIDGEEHFQIDPYQPIELTLRRDNWRVPVAIVLLLYVSLGICGYMLSPRLSRTRRVAVTGLLGLMVPAATVLALKFWSHPAPELAALIPLAAAAIFIGDVIGAKTVNN
jgi:VanZ family protein